MSRSAVLGPRMNEVPEVILGEGRDGRFVNRGVRRKTKDDHCPRCGEVMDEEGDCDYCGWAR